MRDRSLLRRDVCAVVDCYRQVRQRGANYVDGTLFGVGRSAGNCPLELLLGFLKNPKFNIVPILDAISNVILPLRKDIEWGYHVPFMLTGMLNQHPLAAMKWMTSDKKDDLVEFYNEITEDLE